MTSTSSSVIREKIPEQMENTTDSNSESDISDNWAVIDEDSSLEWNNEIKYNFQRPGFNFKNEHSDEESIEVVPDDSDTAILYKDAEIVPDVQLSPIKKSDSHEDILTGISNAQLQDKVVLQWNDKKTPREHHPIWIGFLTLSIAVVIAIGCLWVFRADKLDDSQSVISASALVTKLHLENRFLRKRLRTAQSSLRYTVPRFSTTGPLHKRKDTFPTSMFDPVPNVITTTENLMRDNNLGSDVEYASNSAIKITNIKNTWTDEAGSNIQSSPANKHTVSFETSNQRTNKSKVNNNNTHFDDLHLHSNLNNTVSIKDHLLSNETILEIPAIGMNSTNETERFELIDSDLSYPRPYSHFRNSVEKIYTLTSLMDDESLIALPAKSQLLNSLAQNVVLLDSLLNGNTDVHDKVTNFKVEIQNTTRTLLSFIDQSINKLLQDIANNVKESQNKIKHQFCGLKTEFKGDIALLNWLDKPIFQDCSTLKESNVEEYNNDGKDIFTSKRKIDIVGSEANQLESHSISNEQDERLINSAEKDLPTKKNFTETEDVDIDGADLLSSSRNASGQNKKPRNTKKFKENLSPEKHKIVKRDSKKDDLKIRNGKNGKSRQKNEEKKKKTKESKFGSKNPKEQSTQNHKNSDKEKKTHKKERRVDCSAKQQKKMKKSYKMRSDINKAINVSGEWTTKLAHGRAEQRRRDHESDWVFERAQSRHSNRGKTLKKESCWFRKQEYNQ